tara:strand:- start:1247 stop:1675 length:429 start_codon:yes stop_codon:yes gene_type:complete
MSIHEFELKFPLKHEIIKKNILDFEYYPNFMKQIKEVKILEKSDSHISTQETLIFKSIFTKEIVQTTMHTILNDRINSEITSGMAKGTKIQIILTENEDSTKINVKIDLKLTLKARLFEPLIKKYMKMYVTGILRKINNKLK